MSLQIKHAVISLITVVALFSHNTGADLPITIFDIDVAPCGIQTLNSGTTICNINEAP